MCVNTRGSGECNPTNTPTLWWGYPWDMKWFFAQQNNRGALTRATRAGHLF